MQQLHQRILETTEGRVMGFKPNTRGAFIQAPFTTLEQACKSMDPSVPFNIEPSLFPSFSSYVTCRA